MKKSDIYICGFMYAFSFFFLYLTHEFPVEARHYPYFVIGLLLALTSIRLGYMVRDYRINGKIVNDLPEIFDDFLPKQFWVMFGAFLLFFVLMYTVGFYAASCLYLLVCLKYFKIKSLYMVLVLVIMMLMIYGTFDLFLNVPLPHGVIVEEFL